MRAREREVERATQEFFEPHPQHNNITSALMSHSCLEAEYQFLLARGLIQPRPSNLYLIQIDLIYPLLWKISYKAIVLIRT